MPRIDMKSRPIRSELSVPASDERKIARGLASAADALFLDLEDSVAPERKKAARQSVIAALGDSAWGDRDRSCRINPVGTVWCYRDVIEIVEARGDLVDRFVVPKVQSAADVHFLDRLLNQLEMGTDRLQGPIRLEIQIEDPIGLSDINAIASASPRIDRLTFGQGDFAAAAGMPAVDIGMADEWDAAVHGDRWQLPRQMIVFAAAAAGHRALNGSYADFRDHDGFRAYCRMSRALGFAGTWCIHPDQIAIANEVFTPGAAEVERARQIVAQMETGRNAGAGAIALEGVMIDEATVRMARQILAAAPANET